MSARYMEISKAAEKSGRAEAGAGPGAGKRAGFKSELGCTLLFLLLLPLGRRFVQPQLKVV